MSKHQHAAQSTGQLYDNGLRDILDIITALQQSTGHTNRTVLKNLGLARTPSRRAAKGRNTWNQFSHEFVLPSVPDVPADFTPAERKQAFFKKRNTAASAAYRELEPAEMAALEERASALRDPAVEESRALSAAQFKKLSRIAVTDLRTKIHYMETQLNLTILCLVVPGPTLEFPFGSITIGAEDQVDGFTLNRLHINKLQLLTTFWTFTTEASFLPQVIAQVTNRDSKRKAITVYVSEQLRSAIRDQGIAESTANGVKMVYEAFHRRIGSVYALEPVGWPDNLFDSPYKLHEADALNTLWVLCQRKQLRFDKTEDLNEEGDGAMQGAGAGAPGYRSGTPGDGVAGVDGDDDMLVA